MYNNNNNFYGFNNYGYGRRSKRGRRNNGYNNGFYNNGGYSNGYVPMPEMPTEEMQMQMLMQQQMQPEIEYCLIILPKANLTCSTFYKTGGSTKLATTITESSSYNSISNLQHRYLVSAIEAVTKVIKEFDIEKLEGNVCKVYVPSMVLKFINRQRYKFWFATGMDYTGEEVEETSIQVLSEFYQMLQDIGIHFVFRSIASCVFRKRNVALKQTPIKNQIVQGFKQYLDAHVSDMDTVSLLYGDEEE